MSSEVWKLCEQYFSWRLEEFPEFATFCGFHEYDAKLNDLSGLAFKKRLVAVETFLSTVEGLEASNQLDDPDSLNLLMLKKELNSFLNGFSSSGPQGYMFVLSHLDGLYHDFEELVSWMKFDTVQDFEVYIQRLQAIPNRVESDLGVMKEAIAIGCTHSSYSMELVVTELGALIDVVPESTVFFLPFQKAHSSLDPAVLETLREEAVNEIRNHIQPAVAKLAEFVRKEYLPACRPREGVDSIPGGAEFYVKCLRWHTSLDLSPRQVHDIGRAEVERIRREMNRVIEKTGFGGDIPAFINHLRTDEKFYFKSADECLNEFRTLCHDRIRPGLFKLFAKIPQLKLRIEKIPESRSSGPVAYYHAGTLDGSRPGTFYVNVHDLKYCPKYNMLALSLHEGEPGHHFQMMYALECTNLPRFKQYMDDRYYSHAPNKFQNYTAYCEGWALYCESLGHDLGLYDTDPYSEFGCLNLEMFRACRLVADTGIHALGWTYEEAVKLFMDNTAYSERDIRNEIKRYITWPAQACAYKLGHLKIQELKAKAAVALGEKFDVVRFHDVVLSCGMVPLEVLEVVVNCFIDKYSQDVRQN